MKLLILLLLCSCSSVNGTYYCAVGNHGKIERKLTIKGAAYIDEAMGSLRNTYPDAEMLFCKGVD